MLLIVSEEKTDRIHSIHVPNDADLELLTQMIAAETGVPFDQQELFHAGRLVSVQPPLAAQGITDGELVLLKQKQMTINNIRGDTTPEQLMSLVAQNPQLIEQYKRADPELGATLSSGDISALRMLIMMRTMNQHKAKFDSDMEIAQIHANPDDPENQAKIEEEIRQQNVLASMEVAYQEIPESFASVVMLYVDLEINGHQIKAFVDSGAQSTIMSVECAERCNLIRLIDRRYANVAHGIGTAKIAGRIHIAQMKIGGTFLPISIQVLEQNSIDMLFGLDMLKRHRCCIDLSRNVLSFSDGLEQIPFLSEKDLPDKARGTTIAEATENL